MPERDGPLLVLAGKLRSLGPPSLAILIARLEATEDYEDFVALVREYLPECEREILRQPLPSAQMALFIDRFKGRYFPLYEYPWEEEEDYSYLTRGIPVVVMGISGDDYHEIASGYRPGLQLMTYLLHYIYYGEGDGGRTALAEACAEHVPPELLQRVPEGGIAADEAHRLLDDTHHKGLAHWADMLSADTGNCILDIPEEDLWSMELPPWERETVEQITQDWAQAEVIQGEVMRLAEWLEEDPPARFEELLGFIENRRGEVNGRN